MPAKPFRLAGPPGANVPCEFCSRDVPASDLLSHVLAVHPERLFLCAECNLYRNKRTMMEHMGKHIEADDRDSGEPEVVAGPAPKIVIPVVRIQRVPPDDPAPSRRPASPPPLPAPAPPPAEYPRPPNAESLNASEAGKPQNSKPVPLPAADRGRDVAPPSYSQSIAAYERANIVNEPENNNPSDLEPVDTIERPVPDPENKDDSLNASPKRDEFSDHSENEFERVPESVFNAIEDTEDGHSDEEGNSSDPPTDISETTRVKKPSRTCPICHKTYTSVSSWYYHFKHAHVTTKELSCDTCNRVFATKDRLEVHRRTHGRDKPFVCKVCGKGFNSAAGRYIHEQTHTDKKEFTCTQCGQAFRWRALLKRHEARHAKKRDFVCKVCGRGFSVGFDLLRHARRHEPGCYECELCGFKFKQKRYLKVHMENKHFAQTAGVSANINNQIS